MQTADATLRFTNNQRMHLTVEIAGYEKVTELTEITDNGKYLIVAKANNGSNYLLNPAQGNDKYSYVAKVTGEMYEGETTTANTEIAITGKAEGQTAVTIGDVTYYILWRMM